MNVVEFMREQREQLQQRNDQFKARFQPTFNNISTMINNRISNLSNTLNNPWFSRDSHGDCQSDNTDCIGVQINDGEQRHSALEQSPKAANAYQQLLAQLGQETYIGQWFLVDQECINQFAKVTGDNQWIHTDPQRAAEESPFKSTIAHGFLTLSLIPKLTDSVNPQSNPYPDAKMVINMGLNQVRYPYPVKAGTRVRVRTRLIELTPMKRSIEVVNEMSIEIEHSKRLACVAETVLRLYY